jgi:hypothetical protein
MVERDPTCCGKFPLQAPQQRSSLSSVGGELRETNSCISLWFASLSCFLAYLICFRFDLLECATCVCRAHYLAYDHLQGHHQVWFVLEIKRSLKLFLKVLCGSPVGPVEGNGLTDATC